MPRKRVALSIVLAALTVLFGVGLIATSGYLDLARRRAAADPVARRSRSSPSASSASRGRSPATSTASSRTTSRSGRSAGSARAFYARIEPLAPAQLEGFRRGDLVSRMVGDVDALQGLYLRGIGPPAGAIVVAIVSVAAAALILPVAGPHPRRRAPGRRCRRAAALGGALRARRAARAGAARGAMTADLVELLRGAPELVALRPRGGAARGACGRRTASSRATPAATPSWPGSATGLLVLVGGPDDRGVLAAAVAAHSAGSLDRVLVATVALLALASFEGVAPLPAAAQELAATLAAGRRVLELIDRPSGRDRPAVSRRAARRAAPPSPSRRHRAVRAEHGPPVLDGSTCVLEPGRRVALVGESGAGKTTVDESPVPLPRPRVGPRDDRRRGHARAAPGGRAAHVRPRRPGGARLQLDDPREPAPRAARGDGGRAEEALAPRAARRVGRVAPARARHARRRGGVAALGRPAPAARARARAARRTRRCSSSTSRRRTSIPRRRRS